jgi:hypothetical protein
MLPEAAEWPGAEYSRHVRPVEIKGRLGEFDGFRILGMKVDVPLAMPGRHVQPDFAHEPT